MLGLAVKIDGQTLRRWCGSRPLRLPRDRGFLPLRLAHRRLDEDEYIYALPPLHLFIRWWSDRWQYAYRVGVKRDVAPGGLIRAGRWALPSLKVWRTTRGVFGSEGP